jgi:hypothetical protein
MPISARGILATIAASAGQNGKFSKVGTVFVYLLSNFRFDNNLLIVVIWRIFTQTTRSLVALDSGSLYKGRMHGKTLGRNKSDWLKKEAVMQRGLLRLIGSYIRSWERPGDLPRVIEISCLFASGVQRNERKETKISITSGRSPGLSQQRM